MHHHWNMCMISALCTCVMNGRQRLIRREAFSEEGWKKIFYLANGNGSEMRWLLPFMRWSTIDGFFDAELSKDAWKVNFGLIHQWKINVNVPVSWVPSVQGRWTHLSTGYPFFLWSRHIIYCSPAELDWR